MIEITMSCAQCGKVTSLGQSIPQQWLASLSVEEIAAHLGWTIQINGDNLDIYCSEECAQ